MMAALLGCGAPEKKKTNTGNGADPAKAKLLVNEAKTELGESNFEKARQLLDEANRYSNMEIRHQIDLTNQEINKAEAKKVGGDASKLAGEGKCQEALDMTAKLASSRPDTDVPKRVRALTEKGLIDCVNGLIEGSKLKESQTFIASGSIKAGLDGKAAKELTEAVHEAVLGQLLERVTPAMGERKWADASGILIKAVKDGEALPAERDELLKPIRDGIAEDVKKLVDTYFEEPKGAKKALKQVDALLTAGFYLSLEETERAEDAKAEGDNDRFSKLLKGAGSDKKEPESKKNDPFAPTEAVPKELRKLRKELALWVVCGEIRCKVASVKKMWMYGHGPIVGAFTPDAKPLRDLKHGRAVWKIGTAGNRVLVARTDPGRLNGLRPRAHAAWGWVTSNMLRTEDTSEWLPPGNAIIGTLVWGPLRTGDKKYELGKVTGVEGASIQVQRLADRDVMIVARAALHYGVVKKGLKVLAFCEPTKQQEAVVESVKLVKHETQGDSKATVVCMDDKGKPGKTHEDAFGALRIKPQWLPRRR